jgi:uncharacterized phage-like protein YoqJ
MIVAGTGHRPKKLGGYGQLAHDILVELAQNWLENTGPELVISGMALGWDQALARAAVEAGIPFDAYVPCHGHPARWPEESQRKYAALLEQARDIKIIHDGPYPGPQVMQQRNEAMVDNADTVLALWDGSSGGTANCVRYAERRGVTIVNLWERYENF